MATTKARGSAQLTSHFGKADIAKLEKISSSSGVALADWFPQGIPNPDGVWGTWHVKPDAIRNLLDQLLKLEKIPGIRVFPRGIPKPDLFDVVFEAGSAKQR